MLARDLWSISRGISVAVLLGLCAIAPRPVAAGVEGSADATSTAEVSTPTQTDTARPTPSVPPIEISCEIVVDPPMPTVGDAVHVTVQRRSTGLGYPSYTLNADSLLAGESGTRSSSGFSLQAVQAGITRLSASTMDEFITGYFDGHPSYSFYPAYCSKPIEVLGGGPTPTPTPITATPTFTPTSCVSDLPSIEVLPAPISHLRRTITGFNRGLFCFRGGTISIQGADVLALTVDCGSGRYTADILLRRFEDVTVCHHPGTCGSVGCQSTPIPHSPANRFFVDTVEDGADEVPGDGRCATSQGTCTLRAAVQEANAGPAEDTVEIHVEREVYALASDGEDDDSAARGDLDVTGEVVISVKAASFFPSATIIMGPNTGTESQGVFDVHESGVLFLSDVTIRGGRSPNGAGIANAGFVGLDNVVLSDNIAGQPDGGGGFGGGLWNRGRARLLNVSVAGNRADAIDGIGTSRGGGIWNDGFMHIAGVTISGNAAVSGGGVFNAGSMEMSNATVSGNLACCHGAESRGGGILNEGGLTLRNVTVAANSAVGGGSGLYGFASIAQSILADNPADAAPGFSDNCGPSGAQIYSGGFNIDSDASCELSGANDRVVDPLLWPLRQGGGRTHTHMLRRGSPAIDAAGTDCLSTDQRGGTRPLDGDENGSAECDIGAVEVQDDDVVVDCLGDCNGDGSVQVNELVLAVGIVLDRSTLATCRAVDGDVNGEIGVDEIVGAVARSLHGCS